MLNRIKKLCREKNIAYKDLSDMTGISVSTISKFMSGVIREPSYATVEKLAKALDVTIDYLIYGLTQEEVQKREEKEILELYSYLNTVGKTKVIDYILDLMEIEKYTITDDE